MAYKILCLRITHLVRYSNYLQLRHGSKARYGWVANPCRQPLLIASRQGLSPCNMRRALLGAITRQFSSSSTETGWLDCTLDAGQLISCARNLKNEIHWLARRSPLLHPNRTMISFLAGFTYRNCPSLPRAR
jgi:hypothetical protein